MHAILPFAALVLTAGAPAQTLDSLRDQARPLLIFTPTASDPRLLEQADLFTAVTPGLKERQILIFIVTAGNPNLPAADPSVWQRHAGGDPELLRRRFSVDAGAFTVILLGKDGGEKLRSNHPIPFATLRDTIDAMPMRQQEMRHP